MEDTVYHVNSLRDVYFLKSIQFKMERNKPFYYTPDEWFYNNRQQYKMTQDRGVHAEKLLEQSDRVREWTNEITVTKKVETDRRFKQRIGEIEFIRTELENVRKMIQDELEALELLQNRIQDETQYVKTNARDIVLKCIQFRKSRQNIDLIHDEVETELEKEEKMIREVEDLLEKTLEQTKETKRELRASLYSLNRDVEGKLKCLAIELECLNMKETNSDLCVFQGYQPSDNGTVKVEEWYRYSDEIMKSSKKRIQKSRLLQSHVKQILEQIITDLREQCMTVNEAFQRRILDVKEAKAKLETEHYEMARQVNDMTRNISELEKSIQEKEGFLALAQTRLEKRSKRPGVELVKDEVEASLVKEILEIKHSVSRLQHMLSEAEVTLRYLLKAQVKLEEDINIKTNSIKIDEVDCMSIRQSINYHLY